jgi:Flp pilus assembly protein CpaB
MQMGQANRQNDNRLQSDTKSQNANATARLVVLGISLAAGIGAAVLASGSKPPEIVVAKGLASTIVVAAGPLEYGATLTDDNLSEAPWESMDRSRRRVHNESGSFKGRRVGGSDFDEKE